jgi:hypothetical protein
MILPITTHFSRLSKLFLSTLVFLVVKRKKPPDRLRVEAPVRRYRTMRRALLHVSGVCLASLLGIALATASELDGKPAKPGPVVHPIKPIPPVEAPAPAKTEGGCGSHGTRVEFVDTPREAATIAKKEQKLVFVLHVSGNFEDPRFT